MLEAAFPQEVAEDADYLLRLRQLAQSNPELLTRVEQLEDLSEHPTLQQAKRSLRNAIAASSGAMKVIEQVVGREAVVTVPEDERDTRAAIKRLFGQESGQITFEMYKSAVERIRAIANNVHNVMIDEQASSSNPPAKPQ